MEIIIIISAHFASRVCCGERNINEAQRTESSEILCRHIARTLKSRGPQRIIEFTAEQTCDI